MTFSAPKEKKSYFPAALAMIPGVAAVGSFLGRGKSDPKDEPRDVFPASQDKDSSEHEPAEVSLASEQSPVGPELGEREPDQGALSELHATNVRDKSVDDTTSHSLDTRFSAQPSAGSLHIGHQRHQTCHQCGTPRYR